MCSHQKSSSPQIIIQHMLHAKHCFETKQNLGYWNKQNPWSSGTSQEVIKYCLRPLANLQLDASMWSVLCVAQSEVGSAPLTLISSAPLKVRLWKNNRPGKNTENKWEGYKPKIPNQEKVPLLRPLKEINTPLLKDGSVERTSSMSIYANRCSSSSF